MTDPDIMRILARARERNAAAAVTGVLVYDQDRFFQCIEGSHASITLVMNRIRADERHCDLEVISHQEIPSRLYPDWHMNLVQRWGQRTVQADGLLLIKPDAVDGLHANRLAVRAVLHSLSVLAWEARKKAGKA